MTSNTSIIWPGFWARLFAWAIDTVVLGIICYAVGWLALGYVAGWGSNGRAFGLVLGVIYFGITGSGLVGGRSIGMRLRGLKVTGLNGRPLGLPVALGRAMLLVGPLMLNGWSFNVQDPEMAQVVGVLAITCVFGVSAAQIYLLLFNLPTRRLLHDLVFRSAVVRADAKDVTVPPVRVHALVAAALVFSALGLALSMPLMMRAWMPSLRAMTASTQSVAAAVNALPEVRETSVLDNTTTVRTGSAHSTSQRILFVTARVRAWPANIDQELARIGATTVKAYRFAPSQRLVVKIVYGFDLGFGSYSNSRGGQFSTACATADVTCLAK